MLFPVFAQLRQCGVLKLKLLYEQIAQCQQLCIYSVLYPDVCTHITGCRPHVVDPLDQHAFDEMLHS